MYQLRDLPPSIHLHRAGAAYVALFRKEAAELFRVSSGQLFDHQNNFLLLVTSTSINLDASYHLSHLPKSGACFGHNLDWESTLANNTHGEHFNRRYTICELSGQCSNKGQVKDMANLTRVKIPVHFDRMSDYLHYRDGMDKQMLLWLDTGILLGVLAATCCYLRLWRHNKYLFKPAVCGIALRLVQFIWPAMRSFALAFGGVCSLGLRVLLLLLVDLPDATSKRLDRFRWRLHRTAGLYVPKKLKHVDLANQEEVDAYWEMYAPKFDEILEASELESPRHVHWVRGKNHERCVLWHHSRSRSC